MTMTQQLNELIKSSGGNFKHACHERLAARTHNSTRKKMAVQW